MESTLEAPAKDIYLPQPATLLEAVPLTAHEKFFKFQMTGENAFRYMPGQFMEVSVPGIGEAPISICSSPTRNGEGTLEMVVRRVGNVSAALHALKVGDKVGLRGPYGTCFPVDRTMLRRDILFICGGIGLVPVRSAIHYVLDRREDYGDITILFGTRRPEDRLFIDELYDWKVREDVTFLETVDVADANWGGCVGVITTLFPRFTVTASKTIAVVCGPPIMYKFVLLELHKLKMKNRHIYLSLERHMRCGVGKCGHCQINGLYACQDGAVFNYADIAAVPEAI